MGVGNFDASQVTKRKRNQAIAADVTKYNAATNNQKAVRNPVQSSNIVLNELTVGKIACCTTTNPETTA